jgi:DnaJ like chaperone protein
MGFSIVTLLAWLATCDGELHADELSAIRQISSASKAPADVESAIAVARTANSSDLQLVCEVARQLPESSRRLFMQMALGVAIQDRVIHPAENHVLRFVADMLGLGSKGLNDVYSEMTGCSFPPANDLSDPSSQDSHNESEPKHQRDSSRNSGEEAHKRSRTESKMSRLKALATLGLDEDATDEDVKLAYRRLARVHHPDRFASLGPEAVSAATKTFQRIQVAYQYLTK